MNETPISNSPPCSTTKDLKAIENTPPSERGAAAKFSVEDVVKREVLCLEDAGHKSARIREDSPRLFCKQSEIEGLQVSEPHAPL